MPNEEFFPLINEIRKENEYSNPTITGPNNVVEQSAERILVNGDSNYIGEACKDINLLNSSGCTVASGVVGVNLFACSGLTVNDSDKIYIKNVEITNGSFLSSGVTTNQSIITLSTGVYYEMTESNYTVISDNNGNEIYFPPALGQTKVYNVKNIDSSDIDIYVSPSTSDMIDQTSSFITLSQYDTITVQSDGSSNYYII